MFARYGQAALMAAILGLTGNAAWAQQTCPASSSACTGCCQEVKCCDKVAGCAASGCCKEGKCCKTEEPCCKDKSVCCKETKCPFCPLVDKLAKHTAIIMVMPASMPLLGQCPLEAMGIMPHPMLPPGAHVMIPPPILSPPGIPPYPAAMPGMPPIPAPHQLIAGQGYIGAGQGYMGNVIYGYGANSNCGLCGSVEPSYVSTCVAAVPATAAKVCMIATPSSDQLEMSIGDHTSIRCKKMTVTIGDNEIALSILDGRVRLRGDDLKATADKVRSDGKDRITLEGDVVLRFKKDGHSANVTGDRIDLSLSSGAVTIKPFPKAAPSVTTTGCVPTSCAPILPPDSK